MAERVYCAPTDKKMSERESRHMKFVRQAAAEGMVLLENNGVLPLPSDGRKIALYGSGARRTIKGGIGSGDVNPRTFVTIEDGFENAGFRITTKAWLESFDMLEGKAREEWKKEIDRKTKESGKNWVNTYLRTPHYICSGRLITKEDIENSDTDTAVYVVARNSGEGADRKFQRGDYLLWEEEEENLRILTRNYEHVILLLNVGGYIDMKFYAEIPGIDAILLVSQGGMEMGNAVLDVLTGKVTPSGKLTGTWAENYEDYPSSATFSNNDGNDTEEIYQEGIYVGYRYFDTFDVKPKYEFGYGRSYTDFLIQVGNVSVRKSIIEVDADVTNIGNVYSGREVIQVYLSLPTGMLEKPYQVLAAFEKSGILAPGQTERIKLQFDFADCASYDDKRAVWFLDAGQYIIRVGDSSRNTHIAAKILLEKPCVVRKCRNLLQPTEKFDELSRAGQIAYQAPNEDEEIKCAPELLMEPSSIACQETVYRTMPEEYKKKEKMVSFQDVCEENAELADLIGTMSDDELIQFVCGQPSLGASSIVGTASISVPGAAGETTHCFMDATDMRKIPPVIMADGPAGLRLINHFQVDNQGKLIEQDFAAAFENGLFAEKKFLESGVTDYYQYCTAFPIGVAFAQSWDKDLMYRFGVNVGEEMKEFQIDLWLAPGMNIFRNPLCGRNFEYFSEDPLVSGVAAAAIIQGVQSFGNLGTTIKHFAANNQEDNRTGSNSVVSERTMREIYLRGFEIAVKEAQPFAIMTSYNLINGLHTANSYDLCTAIARDEWGFEGFIMTDWSTTDRDRGSDPALCVKAGNDLIMPGKMSDHERLHISLQSGVLKRAELQLCAMNILKMIVKCVGKGH